jgi:putative CocE/NonD family hydrolase
VAVEDTLDPNRFELHYGAPTSLESDLHQMGATGDKYVIEYRMIPMRDEVRLATVIIRPRADGRVPVVMERTPYQSPHNHQLHFDVFRKAFSAGWAVVIQNERGTGWSDGPYSLIGHGAGDCADTLDWLAGREWSNGSVGLIGCSSSAENQLRIASEGHPALKAGVPMSPGAGVGNIPDCEGNNGLFYKGGIPVISTWTRWYHPSAILERPRLPATGDPDVLERALRNFIVTSPSWFSVSSAGEDTDNHFKRQLERLTRTPPSGDVLKRMGVPKTGYDTYMRAGPMDEVWQEASHIHAHHTGGGTPQLNINGWLDVGAYESVKLFEFQQHHPEQYLIMAASDHCAMIRAASPQALLGDRPVGNTTFPYDDVIWAWFRRFLNGESDAWTPMPKVQVFLMGASQWLTGDRWPLAETRVEPLYLKSGGHAETLWGDGALGQAEDAETEPTDVVLADPENPVQTLGIALGNDPVVCDQRPVEARRDVLVYSTPALEEGIAMVGDVDAVLSISADVPDADVFVKLVDVSPDGTAYNVAWSALRLRYRHSMNSPVLLDPGVVYEVRIKGMTTANYFAPGHQIRLEVAGSNFPLLDRNWHTGGINAEEVSGPRAHITLHHDRTHPSRIEFVEYTGALRPNSAPERG